MSVGQHRALGVPELGLLQCREIGNRAFLHQLRLLAGAHDGEPEIVDAAFRHPRRQRGGVAHLVARRPRTAAAARPLSTAAADIARQSARAGKSARTACRTPAAPCASPPSQLRAASESEPKRMDAMPAISTRATESSTSVKPAVRRRGARHFVSFAPDPRRRRARNLRLAPATARANVTSAVDPEEPQRQRFARALRVRGATPGGEYGSTVVAHAIRPSSTEPGLRRLAQRLRGRGVRERALGDEHRAAVVVGRRSVVERAEKSRNSATATSDRITNATRTSSSEKPRCGPGARFAGSGLSLAVLSPGWPRGR